jgi:O-antigen ligase
VIDKKMVAAAREWVGKAELNPEWGVFWCFAGMFLSMPMGTSPPIIFGAMAALIWLISGIAFRVKLFFKQSWLWSVIPFIILPWLGLIYTPDPWDFGIDYARKTYYWVFCLALATLSFEKVQPRWLINAFLVGLAANACVGVLQFAGIMAPNYKWFSGLTRGYNTVTAYLVLGILVCAFYFREIKGWEKRSALSALMALYFFHLIILEGRTGYLTFILLIPFLIKTLFRKLDLWKIALACLLILGAMYISPVVQKRVNLTVRQIKYHMTVAPDKAWGKEYTEHQDRFYMWMGAIEIFRKNPIIGVGTGGYPATLKATRAPGDPFIAHPHNNILYMAVSYGVLGIFAFFWLFGEMMKNGWRQRDALAGHFVLCAALVLFLNGLFNTTVVDSGTLLLLSLAVGLQRASPKFAEQTQVHHRRTEDGQEGIFFRLSGDTDKGKESLINSQ